MEQKSKDSSQDDAIVKNFDNLIKNAYKPVVKGTKIAQSFPSVHENSLLTASPNYISDVAATSERVMTLVDKLLKSQNISKSMSKLYLEGQKDVLLEANDKLLESINTRIDEMAGNKTKNTVTSEVIQAKESWNKNTKNSNVWQEVNSKKAKNFNIFNMGSSVLQKPQLNFKNKIDNSYGTLFEPKITEKPNSLKPLAILLENFDGVESFSHPYEYELDLFTPNDKFLEVCKEPQEPLPLDSTPLVHVSEPAHVEQLLKELLGQNEIAVDLEHHQYRSFEGYTCLMQISTREKDYIVDTIALRDELQVLNEVFTNPKVLKVFHGGKSDIKWLQKDFGIYVVGMFDTHQACQFLPVPRQSLAYLLKHYCGFDSDKTYQRFDWRIRPLPDEAIKYARSDTHFLLYIYDRMKIDLTNAANGKQNLLLSTFNGSTNVCKLKYEKPVFNEEGFTNVFRSYALLTNQQLYALRELYKWRDKTAREMDESLGYVLPNHMLLQIAQSIPRDIQGIFACCNPVPSAVKTHVLEIHALILKARLQPLNKSIQKVTQNDTIEVRKKEKIKVPPPHDSMGSLHYKGLPLVFKDKLSLNCQSSPNISSANQTYKAQIGLFFEDKSNSKSNKFNKIKLRTSKFETPYGRFLKSKEYAKALEEKLEKENNEQKKKEVVVLASSPQAIIKIEDSPKVNMSLKQIKNEEQVEKEKEKRKKILREREEDEEVQIIKRIKTEKVEEDGKKGKETTMKVKKEKEVENTKSIKNQTGEKTILAVDYSKVNYNKYMVKNKNSNKTKGNKKKKNR